MSFLPVSELKPQQADSLVEGNVLYLASKTLLRAFDLNAATPLWKLKHAAPDPKHYRVPRRLRSSGALLFSSKTGIVHLTDSEGGVIVRCHDKSTGMTLWERNVATPSPLPWTEPEPACDGAQTEELTAFLARDGLGGPALVVNRTSRRSTHSLSLKEGGTTYPAPPFHAQLDVLAFDDNSGRNRWIGSYPEISIPILEWTRFRPLLRRKAEILEVDPKSGNERSIGRCPKPCSWPREAEERVFASWHTTRGVGVICFAGRSQSAPKEIFLERKGTRETSVHGAGGCVVVQLSQRALRLVQSDLRAGPEIAVKGYVYDVVSSQDGVVVVATAGAGGGLYALDPSEGRCLAEHLLPQGAWQASVATDGQRAVAVCGPGLAVVDVRTTRLSLIDLPCAATIAGWFEDKVVVLTGAPAAAGAHLVTI